jgi:AcrR family transcriptional regulator
MGVPARRSPLRHKLRAKVVDTILEAAEQVADEVGLGGMTIAAVAERAEVAVGTLYNYFPDGDGIVTALFRARRTAILPMIVAAAKATKDLPFEDRLREFVRRLLVVFDQQERFLRVAVLADREGNKRKPRDTSLMDETVNALEQIMRDGARRKLFSASRAPIYARMLHGALRSMYVWPLTDGRAMSAHGDLIVDTFLHGVGA